MRKLIVSLGVAGMLLAGVAGPALAHKPDKPSKAERMCEREGGSFIDLGGLAYVCLLPTAANEREIRQAARECEKQGGALFVGVGNVVYVCLLPGGNLLDLDGVTGDPVGGWFYDGIRLLPVVIT